MRSTTAVCLLIFVLGALSACSQVGYSQIPALRSDLDGPMYGAPVALATGQEPVANGQRDQGRFGPGRPYGRTRARLQFFREDLEFDEWDVDFDGGPDGKLFDSERDRFGFRAEFGSRAVGGFFQVFAEEFRAPALLGAEFDNFGVGGGVIGAPQVGESGLVEFVVPFKFEVDLVGGSETVGGFDQDLAYLETMFELGFGARFYGVQSSSGVTVHSLGGLFESDNPASLSNSDPSIITGTNVGVFFELLYKHDRVPLMARARAIVGDVSGVLLSFGFAF